MTEGSKRKGLGRGLGDLLSEHDTDLPFLGAYGEASGEHQEGLPPSAGSDDGDQLLAAVERQLKSTLGVESVTTADARIEVVGFLKATQVEGEGIVIEVEGNHLPLVPSDLAVPGFIGGSLEDDRSGAKVTMIQWGIESRRLFDRLAEHHLLTQ